MESLCLKNMYTIADKYLLRNPDDKNIQYTNPTIIIPKIQNPDTYYPYSNEYKKYLKIIY
jgi:hypothetical protein